VVPEGEASAVAWGLEQTRYFTQGCDDLLVVTDHKPLVKVLGDRTLDEIANPRLFYLKQRTLPWYFRIAHLPGKTDFAADAKSRHPSPSTPETDTDESAIMASIRRQAEEVSAITWNRVALETDTDAAISQLRDAIQSGIKDSDRQRPSIARFWQYCDSLYVTEGVVM
jgi:hypothetical protein